jgi:hypothetical protein
VLPHADRFSSTIFQRCEKESKKTRGSILAYIEVRTKKVKKRLTYIEVRKRKPKKRVVYTCIPEVRRPRKKWLRAARIQR